MQKPTRTTQGKVKISALEQQLEGLRLQADGLQTTQRCLRLQASMLQGYCNALAQWASSSGDPFDSCSLLLDCSIQQAVSEMQHAASQAGLRSSTGSGSESRSQTESQPLDSTAGGDISTIAPLSDPSVLFRHILSLEPAPDTMTELEVCHLYRDTVLQAGMLLHQLPLKPPAQKQAVLDQLGDLWLR